MTVRPTRILVWLIVLALIVVVGFALRTQPTPVDLVTVARDALVVSIDEEGETRVRDRFLVSAPLAGRVLRIEHEPGDDVVANETTLATFRPQAPELLDARSRAEADARVKTAEATLAKARVEHTRSTAERDFAATDLERYVELDAVELVSKDQVDAAQRDARTTAEAVRAAEFAVSAAESELDAARAALFQADATQAGGTTISLRSPIDGVVLRRLRESEAIVPAGEPLLEVADPTNLEIVSDLLSTDAVKISAGDRVRIEQWGGERDLAGRVRLVEPYGFMKVSALGVEEQRVNVIIDFEDVQEAWQALGDGYRVEVAVVIWESDDVLQVPTSSLFRQGEAWAVYAVEGGVATVREVEVGQRTGLAAEILSGLSENEQVIAYPSDQVSDGTQVVAREA